MSSLDRFSQPMSREFSRPSLEAIQEQNELNKTDLVYSFISRYFDDTGRLPEAEDIQETFYQIDISQDLIYSELFNFKGVTICD